MLHLSVIIPTYNRSDVLKKCLKALNAQTLPKTAFEVIVIDDGSTDTTEEIVKNAVNEMEINIQHPKQRR